MKQLLRIQGAAKIGIAPEDFAGDGRVAGMEAMDKVDFLKLP
jgi:hypothetical protein